MSLFAPPAASTFAHRVDALFWTMTGASVVVTAAIAIAIVWFCIRYRRGSGADRSGAEASDQGVEAAWIVAPLLVFFGFFAWAGWLYLDEHAPPPGALTIFVVAKQWMWRVEHAGGRQEINALHVPAGRPVRLVMISQDVIHSFYVPAFRIKQDVVPGRYNELWFDADREGTYTLECAEFCGSAHAHMGGRVVVMPPARFAAWLAAGSAQPSLAARGARRFRELGCSGCHAPGAAVHAPDLHGLYGNAVALADGRRVVADAAYLHDSILLPRRDVVAGYAPIMPPYAGQVDEADVLALVEYIRSLGTGASAPRPHTGAPPQSGMAPQPEPQP